MWETKVYSYVHKMRENDIRIAEWKLNGLKEKETNGMISNETSEMVINDDVNGVWQVNNNKNSKYLTSALAICWEEHSLPFHYQPTTPCRRM